MKKAVYALSADPITYGHINIVERAAKVCDHVNVSIGDNPEKKYLFTKDERVNMAKIALSHLSNVSVDSFEGLLIDYAHNNDISMMIRGIRNTNDMEYEYNLYQVNDSQEMEVETMCLFTKPELSKVSSSNVKGIQKEHGLTEKYVPFVVKDKLEQKISKQKIIGVTGLMGSGKSWAGRFLVEYSQDKKVKVHNLELDDIAKEILYISEKPNHLKLRKKIYEKFGTLDKSEIAKILFSDKEYLDFMQDLVKKPLLLEIRSRIKDLQGIILINSAILIESNMLNVVNNNVIYLKIDEDRRFDLLKEKRNISKELAENRISNVMSHDNKMISLNNAIIKEGYGVVCEVENDIDIKNNLINIYNKFAKELED